MALRRKPSAPAFAVLTVTAAALLAATAAQDTPTGTPPADGAAPTATEAFSEAFGEESRNEAFRGWMMEVRESELWWVGVLLSILGSMLATMGLNLQRYSHRVEAAKPLDERLPYYRQKPWIVGFVLVVLDGILDVLSFGFADLSLVAALGAVTLLFNAILATRFLQERMSRRDTIGTCLVFAGTTTSVIFANRKTPAYAVDELVRNLLEPTFFIWSSFIMLALIAGAVTIRKLKRQAIERHPELTQPGRQRSNSLDDAEAAIAGSELEAPRTQLHRSELLEFLRSYHAVLYAGCAGLAGGQAVSFAKAAVEIVKSAAWGGTDEFISGPGPWLIILATVVMVGVQFHFLNEGLRLFDALSIIPVYQASWIFCGVMGGFVFLGEADLSDEATETRRTTWQLVLFVCGGVLTIIGVSMLIKHQPEPAGNDFHRSLQQGAGGPGGAGHAGGGGKAAPFDLSLMGDTFPIRQSADGTGSNAASGLFTLSRQSLEHMSSHDEATLEEAMIFARRELQILQQENASLRSDVAWRTEVLERVEADLAAAIGLHAGINAGGIKSRPGLTSVYDDSDDAEALVPKQAAAGGRP